MRTLLFKKIFPMPILITVLLFQTSVWAFKTCRHEELNSHLAHQFKAIVLDVFDTSWSRLSEEGRKKLKKEDALRFCERDLEDRTKIWNGEVQGSKDVLSGKIADNSDIIICQKLAEMRKKEDSLFLAIEKNNLFEKSYKELCQKSMLTIFENKKLGRNGK